MATASRHSRAREKICFCGQAESGQKKTARLEAERTQTAEDRLRQVEHLVERLAPELVNELWAEARKQVTKFSRRGMTADESSPFLKAAFHNLVQDRFLDFNG